MHRMFRSSSLFAAVKCPQLDKCQLPNCVFSHGLKRGIATTTSIVKRPKLPQPPQELLSPAVSSIISNIANVAASQDDLKVASPRVLPGVGAPAKHQQRMKYISALTDAYRSHNLPQPRRKAVNEEYKVALKSSNITYGAQMASLLKRARTNADPPQVLSRKQNKLDTMSSEQIYDTVRELIHTREILQRNSYVVSVPDAPLGDNVNSNSKTCLRCANKFELDQILNDTRCSFHERKKRFENTGRYWECCDQVVGDSQGCKTSLHHVFKATDSYEMQALIPFKVTPACQVGNIDKKRIVGLDCEMGFTTKGLELIRLTVMDFYTGKSLFDEIVKPSGEILDLNTTWSGVSEIPKNAMGIDELHEVIFHTIIDQDTIIVGHGLENDLNALRLVHHNVVDTAILFPKGLDKKFALKDLAFQMLDRKIQTGEHSSEEDSLAAIDIIKNYISK